MEKLQENIASKDYQNKHSLSPKPKSNRTNKNGVKSPTKDILGTQGKSTNTRSNTADVTNGRHGAPRKKVNVPKLRSNSVLQKKPKKSKINSKESEKSAEQKKLEAEATFKATMQQK